MARSRGATETRLGPRSMTIADSIVLVLGVALALSLPWYSHWEQRPQPVMEPRWRVISSFFEEAIGKASLALLPLMLHRRVRLGGLCRPGELLLVVCASYTLAEQVGRFSGLGSGPDGIEAGGVYRWSLAVIGAACAGALAGLVFLRGKLSDGVLSTLLVVAVAGSYPWPVAPLEDIAGRLIDRYGIRDSSAADYALFVGSFALGHLVPALIGAAALSETIRFRGRTGAMVGIGLALSVVNLVLSLALYLPGYYTRAFPPWNDPLLYVLIAAPVSSGLLGCLLLLGLRRLWKRWFALG